MQGHKGMQDLDIGYSKTLTGGHVHAQASQHAARGDTNLRPLCLPAGVPWYEVSLNTNLNEAHFLAVEPSRIMSYNRPRRKGDYHSSILWLIGPQFVFTQMKPTVV